MKKIIAIDVGNSETTVGVGNSDNWESYRYTTRKTITSDELLMMFRTTIDLSKADDELLHGAIVCSVVGNLMFHFIVFLVQTLLKCSLV